MHGGEPIVLIDNGSGGEPIVLIDNGSEPTSSVILPCLLTKSLCGLAVVHI